MGPLNCQVCGASPRGLPQDNARPERLPAPLAQSSDAIPQSHTVGLPEPGKAGLWHRLMLLRSAQAATWPLFPVAGSLMHGGERSAQK